MTVLREFNSGTGTWVPIVSGVQGATGPAGTTRNFIINGAFDVWQRGTSSFTTNGAYTADRWQMGFGGTGTAQTVSQVSFNPGNQIAGQEPRFHIRNAVTGGSGNSSLVILQQKIEDVRTFAGQTVTVSFWAKATSGTPSIGLDLYQEFGSGGSATVGGIGAQKFALTTSWQRISCTINVPSISGRTVGSSSSLAVRFWFSGGSDYNSLNGSLGIQSNTFDLWGVQVEPGSSVSPFEYRFPAVELQLCQRYYVRCRLSNIPPSGYSPEGCAGALNFSHFNNLGVTINAMFPVPMRATPSLNTWSTSGLAGAINVVGVGDYAIYGVEWTNRGLHRISSAMTTYMSGEFLWEANIEL